MWAECLRLSLRVLAVSTENSPRMRSTKVTCGSHTQLLARAGAHFGLCIEFTALLSDLKQNGFFDSFLRIPKIRFHENSFIDFLVGKCG
jgi:hypothetical protein